MSDLVRGYGELRRALGAPSGRHAFDEDAALTPIFHALSRTEVRRADPPAPTGDEVEDFHRDPLTAPIPVQAFVDAAAPSALTSTDRPARRRRRAGAHALAAEQRGGRHALLAG